VSEDLRKSIALHEKRSIFVNNFVIYLAVKTMPAPILWLHQMLRASTNFSQVCRKCQPNEHMMFSYEL